VQYSNTLAREADALIDSHGGDLTEDINRFVIIGRTDDEDLHKRMIETAFCYDAHYIRASDIRGSTGEALSKYGIPCLTPESGTPYPVREEEIAFHPRRDNQRHEAPRDAGGRA